MNRRGYIPMVFLLVATLVLMVAALAVMASFTGGLDERSQQTSLLIGEIEFYEDYVVSSTGVIFKEAFDREGDLKNNIKAVVNERDYFAKEYGNLFAKLRSGDFIVKDEIAPLGNSLIIVDTLVLEVKDVFIIAKKGENEIRRNFDLRIEFDSTGNSRKVYYKF
jgi:hypothetical protein